MRDKAPPPLPGKGNKAERVVVTVLISAVVGIPILIVAGVIGLSSIKAFNEGRARGWGKIAATTVHNIDEMQAVMRESPGEGLPDKWRSTRESSVVLGHETPQEFMDRRFGGGTLTIAGREGATATTIVLPDGRRFGPPEVISKGFRMSLPSGWTSRKYNGGVTHLHPSGRKRVQVLFRDVHRGEEDEARQAWINHSAEELSKHASHTRRVGEWESQHTKFYRIDASGDSEGGWRSEYHFTTSPGRVWLVRTLEADSEEPEEAGSDDIQATLQSFQPL
jgi:hypothetical protein